MKTLYSEDLSTLIEVSKPGLTYRARMVDITGHVHEYQPHCPNCGSAEYLTAVIDLIEYVSLEETRCYDILRCEDCGGETCLTYLEKMDTIT